MGICSCRHCVLASVIMPMEACLIHKTICTAQSPQYEQPCRHIVSRTSLLPCQQIQDSTAAYAHSSVVRIILPAAGRYGYAAWPSCKTADDACIASQACKWLAQGPGLGCCSRNASACHNEGGHKSAELQFLGGSNGKPVLNIRHGINEADAHWSWHAHPKHPPARHSSLANCEGHGVQWRHTHGQPSTRGRLPLPSAGTSAHQGLQNDSHRHTHLHAHARMREQ